MPHIFHFSWADESTPQFEYGEGNALLKKALEFNTNLSIEVKNGPACAGYMQDGHWKPCPHQNTGSRKCEDCKQKEGLAVAQFCDGYNLDLFTAEQLEQLSTPHYVYLALFQRDVYKVGVSSLQRGFLRQIEQGTHCACIFGKGMGGILARQIETFFRRCGIADKIPVSQKKDFIFPEISLQEAQKIFAEILEKYLPSLFFDLPEAKPFILETPEYIDCSRNYHLADAIDCDKPFHAVTLSIGESVSGKILAVKGPFIILETDREKVLVNTKDLLGYTVDFSEKPLGLSLQDAFQGALF